MIKTIVIYNPIAGGGKNKNLPELIKRHLDYTKFNTTIIATEYAGHGKLLAKEAISTGVELIIIAGGDGSINEIASCVSQTKTTLGIIPSGSGNGIARHLKLPLTPQKAIQRINRYTISSMDAGEWNNRFFLGFAGLGFDGHIAELFSHSKKRGFLNYAKLVLKEIRSFSPFDLQLTLPTIEKKITNVFIATIANTSQYGNNFKIAPKANASDGKLDGIIITKPKTKLGLLHILFQSLIGTLETNPNYQTIPIEDTITLYSTYTYAHIDGEPFTTEKEITCKLIKNAVYVVV